MAEMVEVTGKSVENALAEALKMLGATRDEVSYEILQQPSNGFFGLFGAKLAKLRVQKKETLAKPVKVQDESVTVEPATEENAVAVEAPIAEEAKAVVLTESQKAQIARAEKFLTEVFAAMKLTVKLVPAEKLTDEGMVFHLEGERLGILIGKHGQTLDSLQYLTNLAANRGITEDRVRILIDIENYRERREETLIKLAEHLAEKACRIGAEVQLEPMNRHERKIIHTALQDNPRVSTFSAGEEPRRYVVIAPKRRRRRSSRGGYGRGSRSVESVDNNQTEE